MVSSVANEIPSIHIQAIKNSSNIYTLRSRIIETPLAQTIPDKHAKDNEKKKINCEMNKICI